LSIGEFGSVQTVIKMELSMRRRKDKMYYTLECGCQIFKTQTTPPIKSRVYSFIGCEKHQELSVREVDERIEVTGSLTNEKLKIKAKTKKKAGRPKKSKAKS